MLIRLAIKSLIYRKASILLTIVTVSIGIFILLGVEHLRDQTKSSFTNSVSGVDLIVGTRTSSLNLLLYSVFRIGDPTNNISWQSYQNLSQHNTVDWAVPISLGDSHQGYRVIGTTPSYFDFFRHGNQQQLHFRHGRKFESVFDLVLGASVANKLGYKIGDRVVLSHGIGHTSFIKHDKLPFNVIGILKATGTPVDHTLHVSLQGLEAVHMTNPLAIKRLAKTPELALTQATYLKPKSITAIMIGLKSKMAVFNFQRTINTNKNEPLSAILPGVALSQLWQTMSVFDNALGLITLFIIISSLLGLSATLLSSLKEREPEIKLLRTIGASSGFIFLLVEFEAMLIALLSALIAIIGLNLTLSVAQEYILSNYGITIASHFTSTSHSQIIIGLFLLTFIAAIPPALKGAKKCHV
ncbi:ABC transporter permease [Psychrobium sp. 1_MG-2023]|uniref:ABC transporter permease n=1 Tax=Psychrobium sp. 1_MG-2023 TaxID=3062624 RepID=UPI000C33C6F4|nr:ABC transporter permease [Psychrobium sp. 1_MG-2023]MDP2561176.1 ABC transporter permease [Psychrobium sp. 1_MG-2023]PKF55148.1 peptide ABC transporter permease [Alteromonadales bacterium alter-6D02]